MTLFFIFHFVACAVADSSGTPLHQAAIGGHLDTVLALLENGCPVDVLDSKGESVLHFAARGGSVEIVNLFHSRGLSVNARDKRGQTPLHVAAGVGKTEVVSELLRLKADKASESKMLGLYINLFCISL